MEVREKWVLLTTIQGESGNSQGILIQVLGMKSGHVLQIHFMCRKLKIHSLF